MDLKCKLVALLLVISVIGVAQCQVAEVCTANNCLPPDCRCSSDNLGAGFPLENTPQLVMITFDAALTAQIYDMVTPPLQQRVNPDGCPASMTYFASHEYTDYSKVHSLWANGHELGLNSISHASSLDYWRTISMDNLTAEFGGQRELISHFGNIESDEIFGIRIPSNILSGDNTFKAVSELGFLYDSTWGTQLYSNGLWPYTLDFRSTQDCPTGNCPTSSIPGVWVVPNTMWTDLSGFKCANLDACIDIPSDDLDALIEWLMANFHRHYLTTKAPFPINLHGAWFLKHSNHMPAFEIFLNYLDDLPDLYFVSQKQVVEYMRDPRPIGLDEESTTDATTTEERTTEENTHTTTDPTTTTETQTVIHTETDTTTLSDEGEIIPARLKLAKPFNNGYQIFDQCQILRQNTCLARLCNVIREDTGAERWMTSCAVCPAVFPWVNNPLGLQQG